jgi:Bacterial lipocalin
MSPVILLLTVLLFAGAPFLSQLYDSKPLDTVPYVNLTRYSGHWFVWANQPIDLTQHNCYCSIFNYTLNSDGTLSVEEQCNKGSGNGTLNVRTGTGTVLNKTSNAQIEMKFSITDKYEYDIIALDENYTYALVGNPARTRAYIISRHNIFEQKVFDNYSSIAFLNGFNNNWRYPYQGKACYYNFTAA